MNHIFILLFMFIVGGMIALQGAVNSRLGNFLDHPLHSAMFSFGSGFVALLIAALVMKTGYPSFPTIFSAPKIILIGGLLGTFFVTSCIYFIPKIGVANVLLAALCGQIVFSIMLDYFGAFGVPKQPIDIKRALGAILVISGVVLINMTQRQVA